MTDLRLLDAPGLAELLDVPETWIRAEARAERIPHLRLGRYVRFQPEEVERWLRDRRKGPIRREGSRR